MEDTRIDRLEVRFDELAAEMRSGFRAVDSRLCKIESRLEQTASKAELTEVEGRLSARLAIIEKLQEQNATKADLKDLRTEMYKNNAELKTWLLATIIALFSVALVGLRHWNG